MNSPITSIWEPLGMFLTCIHLFRIISNTLNNNNDVVNACFKFSSVSVATGTICC